MSRTIPRLPLSFGQRRLWFLDQLRPGAVDYNLPMLVRLRGRLDAGALRAALTEIVARHEVLRTRYAVVDGEPAQVVEDSAWLELTETDVRGLDRERVDELVESGWRKPFNLAGGQVLRVALFQLADDEHLLLIVTAHIAFDGWSWGVLARELRELYRSLTTGEPVSLAPLPIQYGDFARWQQEWLSGQRTEDQLEYWRGRLAGLAPLELPTDRPRPLVLDATGARAWFTVPAYLVAALARIARQHRASPFMVLLAGFQLLLGRYAGTDDVAVGSPVAGRNRMETEDLIGFFVNTLVLRADLRGDPSFVDLLERVRNTTLDAFDHQDVPFERLVDELVPDRDLSRNPLYQVSFVLQNAAAEPLALPGMAVEPVGTPFAASPFDLTLHLVEQADGSLAGVVDYASALFDEATITRLGDHYVRLLTSIADDPTARLSELEWLTEPERTQVLVDWNDTGTPMPSAGVHELFEAQVARTPEAVAIRFGDVELTYAEVNAAANRLAARLRSQGVEHDSVVALCLPREPSLVVAVFGVLKADAAYLPLDPDHPVDRLRDLITDSGVAAVLTTGALRSTVDGSCPVILVDDDPGDTTAQNPVSESTPDSLAYVVYTSGSTGRPKGVPIPHRALVNYVTWCQSAYATPGSGSPLYSSLAFDMPVTSVFPALLSGDTVTIIAETGEPGLGALVAELERGGFGLLKMTPSHLAVLGQSLSQDGFRRAARRLVVGGEELPGELLAPWARHAPDTLVDNEYGPTETTVGCSLYAGTAAELPSGVLPIGRPIANTRMYVLDRDLRLLPVGVAGELYIGGAQLARGYVGRPELTAERFVPDPYSPEPGGRLYRSGDLARYRADGNIVFAGRVDDYVKIGGYRVEPTEVEETLARHPAVRTAVVVVRDRQLVAYLLPADGADLRPGDLRTYLAGRLPAYLVPQAFVTLPALPFTPSGKIDRKALPAPAVRRPELTGDYVPPVTPAQQTIAAVWADVLDVDRVGLHDDFFDLGGHSLLATRAIFALRDAFGADLALRLMFEHRTVAGLADVITNQAAHADRIAPIVAVRRDGPVPLSFGQHRLWFLDRLQPCATDYLSPVALRLRGPLDPAALGGALDKVVARHEVLRTRFRQVDGEPTQLVDPPGPVPVEHVDLTGLEPPAREASVHTVVAADLATPFDLERQWPVRATVIRLADTEHVLLLTVHHSAFDGWSVDILATELAEGYADPSSTVDPLPVQYADYAVWQRELLSGGALAAQLDYWRDRLAGLATLELPTDRPRPPVRDSAGAHLAFTVPAQLARTLTKLGRAQGATPFMVLLAAFQVLLGRYTGQADVAVGTPVAGRDRAEIEKLIGFFVNTVVMRADLSGEPSFVELVNRVRRGAVDAYANADLPFERLVDELRPTRDLSRNPLFGVLFDLRHARRTPFRLPGVEVDPFGVDPRIAKFDLSLTVDEQPDGELCCYLGYATALFDRTTIERMAGHFGRLLESIAADPHAPVSRLDLLTPAEREQLLVGWRGQLLERPHRTLPELFADQARSTPDAPAVVSGDHELTYARLNARANQLADHLRSLGVGPETPVAVAMRRDADLVTSLVAVLKAGACFVPLDPDYPADRLAFMVRDSGARVVLTQSTVAGQLTGGATVLAVDTLWDRLTACSVDDPPPVDPFGAAYVMYTSGSTGEPKGVVVTHAGIRNRVLWAVDRHRLGPADRLLQKTTIGFDAAMWEFLAPLVSGGAVVPAPDGVQRDAAAMVRAVVEHDITVLQLVPSMLRLLVEEPGLAGCRSLRMIFCGGEALPARLCARAREVLDVEVFNTFGMTECSIDVTAALYDPADPGEIVPAGTALPNTQILVLDAADNPVPIGLPGEICVAGVHLARGYVNRPDATAVRFTPNPFGTVPGDRLCRSGDLGRWRVDGSLEVLGRLDHQVKVNGVRIELGEIEAALGTHPGVRVGIVSVHQPSAGDKRLVAYVLPADGARPDAAELRAHLGQRLPAPMLPSIFLTLDELPLTSSGKVDRTALPVPDGHRSDLVGEYVEPSTTDECVVAAVWADVLGVDRVGARDNFFELGGHSLLATRVIFRLRQVLGVELPLADMFTTPTVVGVAQLLGLARSGAASTPITPVSGVDGLALSFAQQRLWFLDQLDPGSTEYLVPFALRLRGPLDPSALEAALTDVIARHETLRTRYVAVDGEPVQVIDPPRPLHLGRTELGDRNPADLVDEESLRPIALDREWPIRARLVRVTPDEHLFLLTMHHIAGDGWSTGLLFGELTERYRAHLAGTPSPVDTLPVRYADFAAWQRDWFTGPVREGELTYWRDRLAGLTPTELPTDRPRAAQRDLAGAFVSVDVPAETGDAVLGVGRALGATPFMVLLAAFQVLLARYTGEHDVVVGTPVSGRTRAETADMIGLFVNTLVLRGDLSGEPGFTDLVARVRDAAVRDYPHQDLPFEQLVDELAPERDLSRNPLFQIMFEADAAGRTALTLGDVVVEPAHGTWHAAKFDLGVRVEYRSDAAMTVHVEYTTALFDRATVERLAGHYRQLLESIAAHPDTPVLDLELRTEAEQREWLDRGAGSSADEPAGCVPELFERRVAAHPDAVAVVFGDVELTYAELNARANRLAHHLRRLGVGRENTVAVCLERGPEAVVALLGVLKAGGVYVPFDPDHPRRRLWAMLEDAGADVVLTQRRFADRLTSGRAKVLAIDDDQPYARECAENPASVVGRDDLAYMIYTSGSTGQPKGVLIEHGSYVQHCEVIAGEYDIVAGDRVVLLSALTFDVAMDQMAATLLAGATVVVSDPVFWSPAELPDRLAGYGVTTVEITPAYYREMLDSLGADVDRLARVKLMNVGSDVVTVDDARRWAETGLPGRFLCNYGPTEATVTCLLHPVSGDLSDARGEAAMPLGRPVPGTRAYVVDAHLRPLPVGVPGELLLGGVRLARGYHRRPELTADRFVPDPFGDVPGARLYRTGDLVRRGPDGDLEFLGRIDQQVKVRGFRIELGEIEAALAGHPDVRAVAVVATDGGAGGRALAAYLVMRDGVALDPAVLRAYLREQVPDYMIPSWWTVLPALPLTTSKKVDRKALPAPDRVRPDLDESYVAPRDTAEEVIVGIWAEVLGRDRIGVHDDFFAAGGHSLLATRVLARLRDTFGVELPLRALFEATTVADLAEVVRTAIEAEIDQLTDAEVALQLTREGKR
ncbi:non-ribosomal peptide synthetase [Actinophytocola oryzae]|uniref:Amino acid adenylation domain-containing protein n=1 Tax=Actinophytocola oryzae TaxID=502181 RepID=A0A4R7VJV9_9PSEU|nr:non-ribosomal peptide synthetase [Actinophytocola oryzae]TDV49743.1 amino acid adenylation domain-containing protein [Actinophytocola oryzae]